MTAVMNLAIMQGHKMVIVPKFDMKMVFEAIKKHQVTLFPGAPTIYIALLNSPLLQKYDLSSIRACISGSAPLPVEIQEEFESVTGGKLVEGYGLTESSPVTHSNFCGKDVCQEVLVYRGRIRMLVLCHLKLEKRCHLVRLVKLL